MRHAAWGVGRGRDGALFRSSRPDYIETPLQRGRQKQSHLDCSGLPDRTTLRHHKTTKRIKPMEQLFRSSRPDYIETIAFTRARRSFLLLFRSSRPDYIETASSAACWGATPRHCSGLPDRTTLRRHCPWPPSSPQPAHCSGLPDRTTLRRSLSQPQTRPNREPLFRSSRPDYIETLYPGRDWRPSWAHCSGLPDRTTLRPDVPSGRSHTPARIVPVFQTGLH